MLHSILFVFCDKLILLEFFNNVFILVNLTSYGSCKNSEVGKENSSYEDLTLFCGR